MSDSVLDPILAAIAPASAEIARQAAAVITARNRDDLGDVARLAVRLAGARHAAQPVLERKHVVVCAGDHGAAGRALAATARRPAALRPPGETIAAARAIAAGQAAVNAVARTAGAAVMVVDCGIAGPPGTPGVMELRVGDGTADIREGPAMLPEEAEISVRTGMALLLSLADAGTDCVALGQLAPGGHVSSAALTAALTGLAPDPTGADADAVAAALRAGAGQTGTPLAALAALGSYETGVMAGVILAAASLCIPVVLDDHGTSAAALVAARLCPHVTGYLVAAHAGSTAAHRQALQALDLAPLFQLGLSRGEGTGAALALPLLDSATQLLRET